MHCFQIASIALCHNSFLCLEVLNCSTNFILLALRTPMCRRQTKLYNHYQVCLVRYILYSHYFSSLISSCITVYSHRLVRSKWVCCTQCFAEGLSCKSVCLWVCFGGYLQTILIRYWQHAEGYSFFIYVTDGTSCQLKSLTELIKL